MLNKGKQQLGKIELLRPQYNINLIRNFRIFGSREIFFQSNLCMRATANEQLPFRNLGVVFADMLEDFVVLNERDTQYWMLPRLPHKVLFFCPLGGYIQVLKNLSV